MNDAIRRLALVGFVIGLLFACERDPTPAATTELPEGSPDMPVPDQVVENGEHIVTIQGVKKAVMIAEQLYFYNQTNAVHGDTIQVNFFDDSGAFVSMLTASKGEMNQDTQEMTARGNVFVRGTDATIRTEELHYDPAANRIFSDQPTEIDQQGNIIQGSGVESDTALKEIRIRGGSAVLHSEPRLDSDPDTEESEGDLPDAPQGGVREATETEAATEDPADTEVTEPSAEEPAEQPDGVEGAQADSVPAGEPTLDAVEPDGADTGEAM